MLMFCSGESLERTTGSVEDRQADQMLPSSGGLASLERRTARME